MWTKFTRPLRSETDSGTEWLDSAYRPHLYTLTLEQAHDPLDADALWEERYGGGAQIVEKSSQDPRRRLRAALDSHRRVISKADARGKRIPVRYVFSDVVVGINQAVWRRELMIGADSLESLAHNLAFRHQEDFQKSLPSDRAPHYVVVPRTDLASHEVCFQFGYGVFVPGQDDQREAECRIRRLDEQDELLLPSWIYFREGQQIERPVGLYGYQNFLLITGPAAAGPVAAPIWFSHAEGYLLLTRDPRQGWQAFADEECVHFREVKTGSGGVLSFVFEEVDPAVSATGSAERAVLLQVRPVGASREPSRQDETVTRPVDMAARIAAREEVDWGGTLIPGQRLPAMTLIPEHTLASRYPYALLLEGIALPRIDGRQTIPGLKGWLLWLDEDGDPVKNHLDPERAARLPALAANRQHPVLYIRRSGETRFSPLTSFPCLLDFSGGSLEVVASPLPERYLGILHLLHPLEFLLDEKPLSLGRQDAENPQQSQISLDQLSQPAGLQWEQGKKKSGRLGDIGLSRRHLQIQMSNGRLQLRMMQGRTPVYILTDTGHLRQILRPGSQDILALPPGERLLIGNYLLKLAKTQS